VCNLRLKRQIDVTLSMYLVNMLLHLTMTLTLCIYFNIIYFDV